MAQSHETIDVRTIEDVQRLLASTDFASADQLGALTGKPLVSQGASRRAPSAPNASAEGLDPLPKRR